MRLLYGQITHAFRQHVPGSVQAKCYNGLEARAFGLEVRNIVIGVTVYTHLAAEMLPLAPTLGNTAKATAKPKPRRRLRAVPLFARKRG